MVRIPKPAAEKEKLAAERRQKAALDIVARRRQSLINPFGSQTLVSRNFSDLAKSLPEMRQLLEEMQNELQVALKEADTHQIKLDKITKNIAQTDFGAVELEVAEALKVPLTKEECTEFSMEIGGECYVGLSQTTTEETINDLLCCADNGVMDRVSKQLRKFGHIHDFKVLKVHQNEIHGLVGQYASIVKYSPSLNEPFPEMGLDTGLRTKNYRLTKKLNSLGEWVLAIVSEKNEGMKIEGSWDDICLNRLKKRIQKIEGEICEIKNSIAKLEPYETPKLNND